LLRTYTVFNVGQVDGLPEEAPTAAPTWSAIEAAQQLIDTTGADIRHGGGVACYVPSQDVIRMPIPGDFAYAGGYYATLLHELAHWTSAPSRCNRQLGKRFGDDAYAAEELIAELGSAFLCAHCRIDGCLQHAAYLDHWLRVLRSDKRAIFTASAAAQKAADYVLGCVPEQGTTALAA
jgi:antirestriction protein ArdC